MKSTKLMHEIVESVPVENRRDVMAALKALRLQTKSEVISTIRNAEKLITLLYENN